MKTEIVGIRKHTPLLVSATVELGFFVALAVRTLMAIVLVRAI